MSPVFLETRDIQTAPSESAEARLANLAGLLVDTLRALAGAREALNVAVALLSYRDRANAALAVQNRTLGRQNLQVVALRRANTALRRRLRQVAR
jgi:hypothetical protein